MTPIKCFMVTETANTMLSLRRYSSNDIKEGPCRGYHNAETLIGPRPIPRDAKGKETCYPEEFPRTAPEWPTKCDACGFVMSDTDEWQHFTRRIYRREDTGEELTWEQMPLGACRDCDWMHDHKRWCGTDGLSIEVKVPANVDGTGMREWMIDSRANNCTLPDDDTHKCWCRHGIPPNIHVDKNPDQGSSTCAAGAGSILMVTGFHGFLHNGHIVSC